MTRTSSEKGTSKDPFDQQGGIGGGWLLIWAIIIGASVLAAVVLVILGEMGR